MKNPVQMAVIGAAHGIKGEVRVKSFTGDPLALGDYGPLHAQDGRIFEVVGIRPADPVVVVRFKGVSDRTTAEALTGIALFVEREALPDTEGEEEFYHADLVGLDVQDGGGETIGKVIAVHNHGGGDILEISYLGREGVLIPFTRAAVPSVDVKAGSLTIDPVAAGLADDGGGTPDADDRPRGPQDAGGNR
jgi:16S rRNA processing protein RimM